MNMPHKLKIESTFINFDNESILEDLSLNVDKNEIVSVVGASAAGKTTLLRAIAGFENIKSGKIFLNDNLVSSEGHTVQPESRNIGIIFQDLALFPHLTVEENIIFGLSSNTKSYKTKRCNELINLLEINDILKKYPHEISGGQQQRVAIARAIAPKPEILLLDEPFSAIDEEFKEQLIKDVKTLLKKEHITTLIVTHNIKEAFEIPDKIAFIFNKKIVQYGTPYDLYHKPTSKEIANFFGISSYINGKVIEKNSIQTIFGIFKEDTSSFSIGSEIDVLIRPDDIIHDDDSLQSAKVVDKIFHGSDFLYKLSLKDGQEVFCYTPSHHNHEINEIIGIKHKIDHIICFNK